VTTVRAEEAMVTAGVASGREEEAVVTAGVATGRVEKAVVTAGVATGRVEKAVVTTGLFGTGADATETVSVGRGVTAGQPHPGQRWAWMSPGREVWEPE
jgi:hypothetical protein